MKFTRPPVVGLSYSNKSNGPQKENSNVYDIEIKPCIILDNNLKLLELVNRFELCIDMNKLDKYSLNFLQELEKNKIYYSEKDDSRY